MRLHEAQTVEPERHCFLIFLAGIGVIAFAVPIVCWSVEVLFNLIS